MAKHKIILDACCGGRMMWFDKKHPLATFIDVRRETLKLCDGRTFEVNPDTVMDFRKMPYADKTFKLVLFDPPHIKNIGDGSFTAKKYGKLADTWEADLKAGFEECMRVLDDYGVLIFKWCEYDIPVSQVLKALDATPLFGHKSGKLSKTHWMCFIRIPDAIKIFM